MLLSKLNLDPGETIILEIRRHWFIFIGFTIASIFGALLPAVAFTVFEIFLPDQLMKTVNEHISLSIFVYMLWLLLMWLIFFIQWTNYYLDVWYITEKRIIDVNQKGMFHREVSNLRFDKIQDISIEVKGVLATFLNFGDLKVQTAAEDSSEFTMKTANAPERVRQIIFSRHNNQGGDKNTQKSDVSGV